MQGVARSGITAAPELRVFTQVAEINNPDLRVGGQILRA
jgi:hypothetical protein